jgi:hypothetical protein
MMQESYDEQRAIIAARQERVQRSIARTSFAFYRLRLEMEQTRRTLDKVRATFVELNASLRRARVKP